MAAVRVKSVAYNTAKGTKTLLAYLRRTGQLHRYQQAKMLKARHLYVTRMQGASLVAATLKVPLSMVERWIISFGWEEERERRMFNTFRKLSNTRGRASQNLDERHERLFGSIESLAERLIQEYQDGVRELDPKSLSVLTTAVRNAADMRRTIHQKESPAQRKVLTFEAGETFKLVAAAIQDHAHHSSGRALPPPASPGGTLNPALDAEFEVADEDEE